MRIVVRTPLGNCRQTSTGTDLVSGKLPHSADDSGRTPYTCDADGSQELTETVHGDRITYTWDDENRTTLVELPTGVRNTMSYEPDGLRIKLEDSQGTKKFIWEATEAADRLGWIKTDGGSSNYLAEADESNDIQTVFTNEPSYYGNLISQRRGSTTRYYHCDALGSTRELTNSGEAITDSYLYDAWVVPMSSTGATVNPFRYVGNVGYYFDADTENNYIRARICRPIIARWLSVDPLFEETRDAYGYEESAPLLLVDPSGLEVEIERLGRGEKSPCESAGARVSWQFSVSVWPCRSNTGFFNMLSSIVRSVLAMIE